MWVYKADTVIGSHWAWERTQYGSLLWVRTWNTNFAKQNIHSLYLSNFDYFQYAFNEFDELQEAFIVLGVAILASLLTSPPLL